jgi:hypothetical protein
LSAAWCATFAKRQSEVATKCRTDGIGVGFPALNAGIIVGI